MAKLLNYQTCWDMRVDANGKWVGTNERQGEVNCRGGIFPPEIKWARKPDSSRLKLKFYILRIIVHRQHKFLFQKTV